LMRESSSKRCKRRRSDNAKNGPRPTMTPMLAGRLPHDICTVSKMTHHFSCFEESRATPATQTKYGGNASARHAVIFGSERRSTRNRNKQVTYAESSIDTSSSTKTESSASLRSETSSDEDAEFEGSVDLDMHEDMQKDDQSASTDANGKSGRRGRPPGRPGGARRKPAGPETLYGCPAWAPVDQVGACT
jgi:hypothetical protein